MKKKKKRKKEKKTHPLLFSESFRTREERRDEEESLDGDDSFEDSLRSFFESAAPTRSRCQREKKGLKV